MNHESSSHHPHLIPVTHELIIEAKRPMEEGSLLEHALAHGDRLSKGTTKTTLIIDLFSLKKQDGSADVLMDLAKLAGECNSFIRTQNFHWHNGGDGPVFGITSSEGVPHLRAYCSYGANVADEWIAIGLMMSLSEQLGNEAAISCWDMEDGQVILIQTWEALPSGFDSDPTDNHRYACWIQGGKCIVLEDRHVSLEHALKALQSPKNKVSPSNQHIQRALEKRLSVNEQSATLSQRTPMVLPRKIVALIQNRPDLVHAAIQAFCENIDNPPSDISNYEDFMWAVPSLSRTNYAMIRTMVSKEWKTTESLPPIGIELKRYKRQCAMETTPHLRHAVQLGVRLITGFEYLAKREWDLCTTEERILRWCRVASECRSLERDAEESAWILESFQQGPNHSKHDLSDIIKCPVFPDEMKNLTLMSHPDQSIKDQIRTAENMVSGVKDSTIPSTDDVDNEEWLILNDAGEGNDLDSILSRFQNFMVQPSGMEGVETTNTRRPTREDIRPRIFMNILHATLKGSEIRFPKSEDPYFYAEDYEALEAEEDLDDVDVRAAMDAMDRELEDKTNSRKLDMPEGLESENAEVSESAHVLGNLLKSLDASAGEPSPVANILKDMEG